MQQATSLPATLDELVFVGRNQAYGAFDLRQHYRPTLSRALWLGIGLFLLGLLGPQLYTRLSPAPADRVMVETDFVRLAPPPDVPPVVIPPAEPTPVQRTVRALPPLVVPADEVREEHLPPTVDDLDHAVTSDQNAEGTGDIDVIQAPEAAAPSKIETLLEVAPPAEDIFLAVEQQPEYPGGQPAMRAFLAKNLRYPASATTAGVSGKVFVSFVIGTDGSLSDLSVLKGIGFGCDEEALRVMRQMPHWKPGKQSGRAVRVRYNLPITFALE